MGCLGAASPTCWAVFSTSATNVSRTLIGSPFASSKCWARGRMHGCGSINRTRRSDFATLRNLYQRLRQSYEDFRLIEEAPVHWFRGYEHADLCTFLTVALLSEWSLYLLTFEGYGQVFVSQSSGAEVWVRGQRQLDALAASLKSHRIEMRTTPFQPNSPE